MKFVFLRNRILPAISFLVFFWATDLQAKTLTEIGVGIIQGLTNFAFGAFVFFVIVGLLSWFLSKHENVVTLYCGIFSACSFFVFVILKFLI